MPHIVDIQIKSEGTKKGVLQIYLESDGSVDFNNDVLFNFNTDWAVPQIRPTDSVFGYALPNRCTVQAAWVSTSWFDITLGWGGAPVRNNIVLARDTVARQDFQEFGGVGTPADIVDYDGTLRISTKDFQPTGSNGMLILNIRKD